MCNTKFWDFVVEEPVFADYTVSIEDFGAVKGGVVSNTEAINNAIKDVNKKGGGHVVVPAGIYLTGPIKLLSNVDFHLERGSVIIFTHNEDDYPLIKTDYEGGARIRAISPISAWDEENLAITGEGIIDGSGDQWRLVKRMKMTDGQWKALLKRGGIVSGEANRQVWFPSQSSYDGHMNPELDMDSPDCLVQARKYFDYYRPVMVNLLRCKRVLLEGVTFQNSPAWNVHPLFCEHLTMRKVFVSNPWNAQNGDGLDLESCRYANIVDCSFNVGDDAICMKAGKNAPARKIQIPTEYVNIEGCTVYSGHGGFVVGSEMSRGVRKVRVHNCSFIGTDIGVRFKSTLGRGGIVEDIVMDDIKMTNIPKQAILFTMAYSGAIDADTALEEDIPEFKNITLTNINAINCGQALAADGIRKGTVHDLTISDSVITSRCGVTVKTAEDIKLDNVTIYDLKDNSKKYVLNKLANDGYSFLMEDR